MTTIDLVYTVLISAFITLFFLLFMALVVDRSDRKKWKCCEWTWMASGSVFVISVLILTARLVSKLIIHIL